MTDLSLSALSIYCALLQSRNVGDDRTDYDGLRKMAASEAEKLLAETEAKGKREQRN
jgi:hypothetical protein